jgi:hypothetical protein
MSTLGTISGGASFWPWFGALPSVTDEHTVYGSLLSSVSSSPWLSVSEKERIEELLLSGSLVIPPPQMNIAAFQNIALHFPDYCNIGLVTSVGGLSVFGIAESAITLAALAAWAQSQHYIEGNLAQALISGKNINPFEVALQQFIAQGSIKGVNALAMQLSLRQIAILHAALKTAPADTVLKAFRLAEQQLIIALLERWNEALTQMAALQREEMIKRDISGARKTQELLSDFIKKALLNQQGLKQPVLSMLIGALLIDGSMISAIASTMPIAIPGSISFVPKTLTPELAVITAGFISSTMMWASPIAMSLITYTPGISDVQLTKASAEAFAIALASLITSPEFDALLTSSLRQAVERGLITESRATTISAAFKASLIMTAMALLYLSETGGLTAGELRGIITGEVTVDPADFLGVLAKLIREQFNAVIDPSERNKLFDELLAFFDGNPSLEDLLSPLKSFLTGWNPQCVRDAASANPG